MIDFDYVQARTTSAMPIQRSRRIPAAKFIAGGTNLIDLMKENVALPRRLIDITGLPLAEIEETAPGGLRIGALVPNSDLAYDERISKALSAALERNPCRRIGAASQHGLDRRQSPAADALPVFLRHHDRLQ